MVCEPVASAGIQIVIPHALSAGRRVDEATVARINRDVADSSTLREKHEVADSERSRRGLDGHAGPCHLS
jgi:hypothetical protein